MSMENADSKENRSANSWKIKATLLLASTLTVMSGATIAPSLPAMQAYFEQVPNADFWIRLVLTIPALFIVIGSPIAGQVVDKVGRKPLLFGSAILYGLAGSSGFWLDSIFAILGGRALLGLAVAGVMVSATTLIADYYQGDERASFMGLQAAFMGFGGVLFLSGGGFIADLSWRYPFLIYLFAWLLVPAIFLFLFEPDRGREQASADIQASADTIERRLGSDTDNNIDARFPVKLLVLIYAAALLQQVVFYLIPVQLPFYLEQLTGAGASQTGLAIALSTLFSAFASMYYGKVKKRLSFIGVLAFAFFLMGVGYIGIGLVNTYWLMLLVLVPVGVGLGLIMPNLNVWASNEVPDALRGRALGGLTTFMFLGQFLSPIVSQPVTSGLGLTATYGLAGVALCVSSTLLWTSKKQVCYFVQSTVGQS